MSAAPRARLGLAVRLSLLQSPLAAVWPCCALASRGGQRGACGACTSVPTAFPCRPTMQLTLANITAPWWARLQPPLTHLCLGATPLPPHQLCAHSRHATNRPTLTPPPPLPLPACHCSPPAPSTARTARTCRSSRPSTPCWPRTWTCPSPSCCPCSRSAAPCATSRRCSSRQVPPHPRPRAQRQRAVQPSLPPNGTPPKTPAHPLSQPTAPPPPPPAPWRSRASLAMPAGAGPPALSMCCTAQRALGAPDSLELCAAVLRCAALHCAALCCAALCRAALRCASQRAPRAPPDSQQL